MPPPPRKYRGSDWPASKKKTYDGPRRSKKRLPLLPLEQYIEDQKERERQEKLIRPFDDPLPF